MKKNVDIKFLLESNVTSCAVSSYVKSIYYMTNLSCIWLA